MRISEARDAIIANHPEIEPSRIRTSFRKQLKNGYSIEQAKARVEQSLYAHYEIKTPPRFGPRVPESRLPKHLRTN